MDAVEFCAKTKSMKIFKQHQQARLWKATVIPASDLAERKEVEEERTNALGWAALDEEFLNKTERSVRSDYLTPIGPRIGLR